MPTTLDKTRYIAPNTAAALAWQGDDIKRRYCRDFGKQPDEGEACFQAFKQFLVVCASARDVRAPSAPIDDMWHTALLFTWQYGAACSEYLGTFIHHEPLAEPADPAIYFRTRQEAEDQFGPLDSRYWTVPADCACGGERSIGTPGPLPADCGNISQGITAAHKIPG